MQERPGVVRRRRHLTRVYPLVPSSERLRRSVARRFRKCYRQFTIWCELDLKMKIALYTSRITYGGAELQLVNLARLLFTAGHDVVVCAGFIDPEIQLKYLNGISTWRFNTARTLDDISPLREFVRAVEPDYLISTLFRCNVVASIALIGLKAKTALILRESTRIFDRLRTRRQVLLHKVAYRFMATMAVKVIAPSQDMLPGLGRLSETYLRKVVVVNNPLRVPLRRVPSVVAAGIVRLTFVGRLEPVKRAKSLLIALSKVSNKNYRLDIFGDGSERKELEALCSKLELEERVKFHGFSIDADEMYEGANLIVSCSEYEGFPNSISEAVVSGLGLVVHGRPSDYSDIVQMFNVPLCCFSASDAVEDFSALLERALDRPHEYLPDSGSVQRFFESSREAALREYASSQPKAASEGAASPHDKRARLTAQRRAA